jgi:hypothetical protein
MNGWPRNGQRATLTTTSGNGVRGCESRGGWLKNLFWSLGTATGLLTAGLGAQAAPQASPTDSQRSDYRSAASAPAAWQEFAKQLQSQFQQRLAADDEAARRFEDDMAKLAGGNDAAPPTLIVRTWIFPDGTVERVESDGLDAVAAASLRTLLAGAAVGAPPPDMLQPLHLRLTLRPNDKPGQEN